MLNDKEFAKGFEDNFCDIEDHRQEWKIEYTVMEMFFLGVLAIGSGAKGWKAIELFGESHIDTLREYFPYKNGTPSDCTIRRFFTAIDPNELNKVLMKAFGVEVEKQYAIDGKTLKGTKYMENRAFHFLNVYACESGVVIYGQQLEGKSNEITAIPEAIESLDLREAVVTIDAMGCQKSIAAQIIEKGGDYILGLKKNQLRMYEQVELLFGGEREFEEGDVYESYDKGHGREEYRTCRIIREFREVTESVKWSGLASVAEVTKVTIEGEKRSEGKYYYISSCKDSADEIGKRVRSHWGIESMHWSLDVTFREDSSSIRQGNAPANMSILRRYALNIFTCIKKKGESRPLLMFATGLNPTNLRRFANAVVSKK